jgi:putative serine protease PepD
VATISTATAMWTTPDPKVDPALVDPVPIDRGRVARLSAPRSKLEFRSVVELVEAVEPSVVQVETNRGLGSGFVLDETGLVVTCNHVVSDVTLAEVVFADGRRAPVIGVCYEDPRQDIAILSIKPPGRVTALALAPTSPKKGAPIVAFGSPVGLSFTISDGSVSALRTVGELLALDGPFKGILRGDASFELALNVRLVQITSSTMPGNSGGPVVDFLGNVVGISSFCLDWNGQIYEFCISADEIRDAAAKLHAVKPLSQT